MAGYEEGYTYNLIKSIGVCNSIYYEDRSAHKYFMKLFRTKYVPDLENPDKLVDLSDFKIIKQKLTQALFERDEIGADGVKLEIVIIKADGTEDSISWLNCFHGPASYKEKLISACILSIHNHPKELVKRRTDFPFVNDFLEIDGDTIKPTTFQKNDFNQWIFKEEDNDFRIQWINYYNSRNRSPCRNCYPRVPDEEGWRNV